MLLALSPPPTLVESAYNHLKADIISSYLKPDEKINLKDLSQRYQVSETPIKQALNRLISEGLIISVPRKGMWVHRISSEEANDIFDLRLMMDTFYLDRIVDFIRSTPTLQAQMHANIQSHIRAINIATSQAELAAAYQLDEKFHGLYISASQNKKITEMYRTMNAHAYAPYIVGRETRAQIMDGAMEHQKIYDAILANEKMEVHQLVTLHLENARHNVCTILKELELTT